jgi:hypothetical protein
MNTGHQVSPMTADTNCITAARLTEQKFLFEQLLDCDNLKCGYKERNKLNVYSILF